MLAKLANLNHCAVPFLSRAAANLRWYDSFLFLSSVPTQLSSGINVTV